MSALTDTFYTQALIKSMILGRVNAEDVALIARLAMDNQNINA